MTDDRSNRTALRYAIKTAQRPGVTRDLPYGPDDLLWVTNSSTLVYGSNDAVLVDTFTSTEQNAELVDWVKSFNKNLTYIYITHGHGDHFFGLKQLLDVFPDAGRSAPAGPLKSPTSGRAVVHRVFLGETVSRTDSGAAGVPRGSRQACGRTRGTSA